MNQVLQPQQPPLANIGGGASGLVHNSAQNLVAIQKAADLQHMLDILGNVLTDLNSDPQEVLRQASEYAQQKGLQVPQNIRRSILTMADEGVRNFAKAALNKYAKDVQQARQDAIDHQRLAQEKNKAYAKALNARISDLPSVIRTDLYDALQTRAQRQTLDLNRIERLASRATLQQLAYVESAFHPETPSLVNYGIKESQKLTTKQYTKLKKLVDQIVVPLHKSQLKIARRRNPYGGRNIVNPQLAIDKVFAEKDRDNTLPVVSNDLLINFPQWAAGQAKIAKKQQELTSQMRNFGQRMTDGNDVTFQRLEDLNPTLVRWNGVRGTWQGQYVQKTAKSFNSKSKNLTKRLQKVEGLLNTQISEQKRKQQVPAVVQAIVQSNQALSTAGFGPISAVKDAPQLYAGRWVDHVTGKIRELPKATAAYLNPLSLQQKLAFIEARILNNWNQIVTDTALRTKLKGLNAAEYAKKQMERIKSGLSLVYGLWEFNQKISDEILRSAQMDNLDLSQATAKQLILHKMGPKVLLRIYQMPYKASTAHGGDLVAKQTHGFKFDKSQEADLKARADEWIVKVDEAAGAVANDLKQRREGFQNIREYDALKQADKIIRAAEQLTNTYGPLRASLGKLVRAMTIPEKLSGQNMVDLAERVDQNMEAIRKSLRTNQQVLTDSDVQTAFQAAIQPYLRELDGIPDSGKAMDNARIGTDLASTLNRIATAETVKTVPRTLLKEFAPRKMAQDRRNYVNVLKERRKENMEARRRDKQAYSDEPSSANIASIMMQE